MPDIIIVIRGGSLECVAAEGGKPITYRLIDLDNYAAGDPLYADYGNDHSYVSADVFTAGYRREPRICPGCGLELEDDGYDDDYCAGCKTGA